MSEEELETPPFPSSDHSPVESILYVSLPDDMDRDIEGFRIDPTIPLPVEPPPGVDGKDLNALSWEMIVAAMLKIFAYQPEHPHADYFRRFIRVVQPQIVQELTETGILKARNGNLDLAEEIFRSLVNLSPEQESSFVNLALLFEQRADTAKNGGDQESAENYLHNAMTAYRRGSKYHPESLNLHFSAGHFFMQQNNIPKAKEHFSKYLATSVEGGDPEKRRQIEKLLRELNSKAQDDILFAEAFDFIKMGQEEMGISRVEEFLQRNPEIWNAWFLLGWGLRRTARYREAAEALEKSLSLHKDNPDTYNELSICYLELEEYPKARRSLEAALRLEPENTKVISNLGILALKQEDFSQAKGFFKTVLDIDPDDPIAAEYLDKLEQST
ncbi:MAG TPA: tetratricopeptide repeat protein [Sediminispirochaeta sp.]|nr:tetratricopeptide repeat protein [Sediminispirochaeta sp.]